MRNSPIHKSFLSSTLGSNMVLQRAPDQAVVWGFTKAGATVTTTLGQNLTLKSAADAQGVWRQFLPPMEASHTPYTLTFSASTGETARMENVLFGDVYLCGGQSNMQFAMPAIENASTEAARADAYPSIRLFSVGQGTSSPTPLDDLQTIQEGWTVANHTSIAAGGAFGYFSAVCWIFGRELFDALGGKVPIGLISNNWGGTPVESWTTPEALQVCNRTTVDSKLFNAMINPYTVGPMSLVGFTWYQGEANVDEAGQEDRGATKYACTFPAMISAWRKAFRKPDAYFGFIQLSTWCGNPEMIAEMRTIGQMSALALPKVGYATNADHGAGCNIHPPPKQYCAQRLANSALALQYGKDIAWRSPTFKSSVASASPPSVQVSLNDVSASGLTNDQYPFNYALMDCSKNAQYCAWASLQMADGTWVNATISVESGSKLRLTASETYSKAGSPVASRYAWGAVPMMSAYDKQTNLPVLPWSEPASPAAAAEIIV